MATAARHPAQAIFEEMACAYRTLTHRGVDADTAGDLVKHYYSDIVRAPGYYVTWDPEPKDKA